MDRDNGLGTEKGVPGIKNTFRGAGQKNPQPDPVKIAFLKGSVPTRILVRAVLRWGGLKVTFPCHEWNQGGKRLASPLT